MACSGRLWYLWVQLQLIWLATNDPNSILNNDRLWKGRRFLVTHVQGEVRLSQLQALNFKHVEIVCLVVDPGASPNHGIVADVQPEKEKMTMMDAALLLYYAS